jgi:hypothetical protein
LNSRTILQKPAKEYSNSQVLKARVKIGGEIILDIWETDKRRWANLFSDMVELTPFGDEFQVCPKTDEWLRAVPPQFLLNHDNLPEDIVLSRIREFAGLRPLPQSVQRLVK